MKSLQSFSVVSLSTLVVLSLALPRAHAQGNLDIRGIHDLPAQGDSLPVLDFEINGTAQAKENGPEIPVSHQVTVGTVVESGDLALLQSFFTAYLKEERKKHPSARIRVVTSFRTEDETGARVKKSSRKIAEGDDPASVGHEIADDAGVDYVEERLPSPMKQWLVANYNYVFTAVRFVANGTVTVVDLSVSKGVPLPSAIVVGVITGSMSGGLQLKNEWFNDALGPKYFRSALGMKFLMGDSWAAKSFNFLSPWVKWYIVEVIFVAGIMGARLGLGIDELQAGTFLSMAKEFGWGDLVSAWDGFVAQAPWDVSNSRESTRKLKEAKTAEAKFKVGLRRDAITLLASAVQVLGISLSVSKNPLGREILRKMGVFGAANVVRVRLNEWAPWRVFMGHVNTAASAAARKAITSCNVLLDKMVPFSPQPLPLNDNSPQKSNDTAPKSDGTTQGRFDFAVGELFLARVAFTNATPA